VEWRAGRPVRQRQEHRSVPDGLPGSAERREIRIGDLAVSGLDDAQHAQLRRDRIGFVFQQFFLLPTLNTAS
jgi:predicted ABC-type transport system involved in lysophospholipase L1 biosynthesis ATPase subunit